MNQEINNLAFDIMQGLLTPEEIFAKAKRIHDLSLNANWTPCADGLPTKDGFYMATIRIDNVLQHGEYESRVEFDRGHWCGMSSDMKVVAWRNENPYKGNHIGAVNKKADHIISDARTKQSDPESKLDMAKAGIGGFIGT